MHEVSKGYWSPVCASPPPVPQPRALPSYDFIILWFKSPMNMEPKAAGEVNPSLIKGRQSSASHPGCCYCIRHTHILRETIHDLWHGHVFEPLLSLLYINQVYPSGSWATAHQRWKQSEFHEEMIWESIGKLQKPTRNGEESWARNSGKLLPSSPPPL